MLKYKNICPTRPAATHTKKKGLSCHQNAKSEGNGQEDKQLLITYYNAIRFKIQDDPFLLEVPLRCSSLL